MNISSINKLNNVSNYSFIKDNIEQSDFKEQIDNAIKNNNDEKLKEACRDFESYFLKMMMSSMRKSSDFNNNGLFEKSDAEITFQDMLDEQICENIANGSNSVGLANMMYEQLSSNKINNYNKI